MLGLALQGGGAKGAFQAGAIRALFEEGYTFQGVVGTSIGALNGALVAQGDFDMTYELWYNMEISQLFDVDDKIIENIYNYRFNRETIGYVVSKVREALFKGVDRAKGRELINNYLDEDKLRASPVDFGMVTVERSGKFKPLKLFKEDIPYGLLIDYIIASGNLPIFNDLEVEGRKLYDGGIYDNLPINMLIDRGYKDIIAIRLGDSLAPVKAVKDISVNITYIDPSEKPGSLLNFTNNSVRRAMIMGYYDALRTLKGYLGKKYYIYPFSEEDLHKELFRLPDSFISECINILTLPQDSSIERIIAEIKTLMKLSQSVSERDTIIYFIEAFALYSDVERFQFYYFKALVKRTIKAYNNKILIDIKKSKRTDKLKRVFEAFSKL